MPSDWEKRWHRYQDQAFTDSELVSFLIHALDDADVATLMTALPDGYRDVVKKYVEADRVPWGLYHFIGSPGDLVRQRTRDDSRRKRTIGDFFLMAGALISWLGCVFAVFRLS